jgi:hypothetical protein
VNGLIWGREGGKRGFYGSESKDEGRAVEAGLGGTDASAIVRTEDWTGL